MAVLTGWPYYWGRVKFHSWSKLGNVLLTEANRYITITIQNNCSLMTVQYNMTLFYYASHTQQKLDSRWGIGKHITLQ